MTTVALAVDMHGGDLGCGATVEAIATYLSNSSVNVNFLLCGDESKLFSELKTRRLESYLDSGRLAIVPSDELAIDSSVSRVWRDFPRSSLVTSLRLQAEGEADGTLSAGDTGALYSSSLFLLGKQEGIERPALAGAFPSSGGGVVLILDIGANLECRPQHLADFGKLGAEFMRTLLEREPKVGLLNVGSEPYKGTSTVREAAALLSECSDIEYNGFIEGNRVLTGDADVIVCDGFTGNALLKLSEGMFRFVKSHLAPNLDTEGKSRLSIFDAELYGAVPILGICGSVFKAHGGSSALALTNAITTSVKTLYLMKQKSN